MNTMLSTQHEQLAHRDPKIPGLPLVFDPETFAHLWSKIRGLSWRPETHIEYIRYKPGRRCIVLYRVQDQNESQHVVATAHNSLSWHKHLHTFDRGICDTLPDRRDGFANAHVSVGRFPNDRRLRRLQQMQTRDLAENFVRSFVDKQVDSDQFACNRVSYKPSRRAVYKVRATSERRYALKFFDKASFEPAKKRCLAWDRCRTSLQRHGVEIPELIRANTQRQITVTDWLRGDNLADAMCESHLPNDVFCRIGSALGELHHSSPRDLPKGFDAQRPLSQLAENVAFLVPDLQYAAHFYATEIQSAIDAADSILAPIHGDFYAKQVCVDDDSIGILDFDQSVVGDPLRDVGNFIAKLLWNTYRGDFDSETVPEIERAFLHGYALKCGSREQGEIDLHVAAGLFRCLTHPFRGGSADWTRQTSDVMRLVRERFDRYRRHVNVCESFPMSVARSTTSPATSSASSSVTSPVNSQAQFDSTVSTNKQDLLKSNPTRWMADVLIAERARECILRSCPELSAHGVRLDVIRAEPMRHKLGRRCLVRYDIQVAQSQAHDLEFSIVGKTRFKGVDERSYLIQSKLWQAGLNESNADGIEVPKPLGIDHRTRTWFQDHVPGEAIESLAGSQRGDLVRDAVERSAAALAVLHGTHLSMPLKRHTREDELTTLCERLKTVKSTHPTLAPPIDELIQRATKIGRTLCDDAHNGIHRDFYPAQMLATRNRTFLLDFDLYCRGPMMLDAGNFLGHLWELSIRHPEEATLWRTASQRFASAYLHVLGGQNHRSQRQQLIAWAWLTLARHVWISTQILARLTTTPNVIDNALATSEDGVPNDLCAIGVPSN